MTRICTNLNLKYPSPAARCDPVTGTRFQRPAVAVVAVLLFATPAAHADPQPKQLAAELKALGARTLAEEAALRDQRYHLPCDGTPQAAGVDKLLAKRVGQPVTISQICAGPGGTLIGFWFTKAGHHSAQIVRITDPATVTVLAARNDMKNCDDGMCDHFSSVDLLEIAHATDLDGDGILDPLIDFATHTGDQGHASHSFVLWLSRTRRLLRLGGVGDQLEQIETFPDRSGVGFAVSTRMFPEEIQRTCFNRAGAMRACPASVQATWSRRARRLEIAGQWNDYTDDSTPPDTATLARLLTELGVTSEVKARLTALATPTKP